MARLGPMLEKPEYLTPRDLEHHYGLARPWQRRARRLKSGPPYSRAGYKTVLYRRTDVEAWLSERRVESSQVP